MSNFKNSMNAIEEKWPTVEFKFSKTKEIYEWLESHMQSRYLMSTFSVRFEDHREATYFKLKHGA